MHSPSFYCHFFTFAQKKARNIYILLRNILRKTTETSLLYLDETSLKTVAMKGAGTNLEVKLIFSNLMNYILQKNISVRFVIMATLIQQSTCERMAERIERRIP